MRIIEIDNGGIEIFRDNGDTVNLDASELFALRSWFENDSLFSLVSNTVQDEINAETVNLERYHMSFSDFCSEVLDDVKYRLDMYPDRVATQDLVRDSIYDTMENHEDEYYIDDDRDDEYYRKDD